MSQTPPLLWQPAQEQIAKSNLKDYQRWLAERGTHFRDYHELWNWSVREPAEFWSTLLSYFDIQYDGTYREAFRGTMPKVRWFEGISLNLAEHVFRKYTDNRPALIYASENAELSGMSWAELKGQVAALADFFQRQGIQPGDRIAAYLPCIPEATIAFLATNSLGAVWSSSSPDFGAQSIIDRYGQIQPKILVAAGGYRYGGKFFDKTSVVEEILKGIPSVQKVVFIPGDHAGFISKPEFVSWAEATGNKLAQLQFRRVPFSHPVWILYSSGTTGLPKAITHGQGSILLEHLKYLTFHNDLHAGERFFWYTTTGWMMWNYVQGALLCGAVVVLYDGSPAYPNLNRLWEFSEQAGINHFGTSAGFLLACRKAEIEPGMKLGLKDLRSVGSTGSTLPPEGFDWVYNKVKKEIWLASMSGGTDVCSAFVGGNPEWPVYSGEIQCRALGCSLEAWNEAGESVVDEVGEMVITQPMPSMPIYFWNDPEFKRYEESYFEMYPGIWRHGDWIKVTGREGVIIYGRSDATLNRGGVRIGTSEVYRVMDKIQEIRDSLILCLEKEGGKFYMPLFVVMKENFELTIEVRKKINALLRTDYSPRHVPDEIIAVPDIPYTISGKKTETPVKKILMGKDPEKIINPGALRNPESMDFFVKFYNARK